MDNGKKDKIIIFVTGILLITAALSVFALLSGALMGLLGFKYRTVWSFILFFIIASALSYPMNIIAGALPKALERNGKISKNTSAIIFALLDSAATFSGFCIVDCLMPSVSANALSLAVISVIFMLLEVKDIKNR